MPSKTEIIIDGQNRGAITAINGVKQEITGLGKTIGGPFANSMKSLSGYLSFAAVGTGIGALAHLTKQAIDTADEIYMMSQKIGISVESLSVLRYAAEQSGLSLDQLQTGIKKLSTALYDVAHGQGQTVVSAFRDLGINALDMNNKLKPTEQVLLEIADKFSLMSDGTEKSAIAVKLFGRAALELIPFLNEGSSGISDLTLEAEKLGLKLDTQTAAAAESFNDSLNRLNRSIDGLANRGLPGLLDFFTGAIDGFQQMNDAAETSASWTDWWSNMYTNAVITGSKNAANIHREAMAEAVNLAKTQALDKIKGMGLDGIRSLVTQTRSIIKGISGGAPYADQQNDVAQLTAKLNVYTNALKPAKDGTDKLSAALYDAFGHPIDKDGNLANNIRYLEALQKSMNIPQGEINPAITTLPSFDMQLVDVNPFDPIQEQAINFFDMYDERASQMRQNTSDMFGNMGNAASAFYQLSGQKSKEWFAVQKGFNIAQAIMNTYEGATKALAQGGFFGIAMAATVIAAGLAQVAMIASQQPGSRSSGGGSVGGGGGSVPSSGSQISNNNSNNINTTKQYVINFNGTFLGGDQDQLARDLIEAINKAQDDGLLLN